MLKALIVDDEPLARGELAYLLRRTGLVEVVGEADRLEQAIERVRELEPDVVFLDIQLEGESGLDVAKRLAEGTGGRRPEIVFATAYDEYALQAFDLEASDYVLKPFEESRIETAVSKIARRLERKEHQPPGAAPGPSGKPPGRIERLPISVDDRIMLIPIDKILFICFEDGKTSIVTEDRQYRVNDALTALERKLQHSPIVRVHRAYLVNLDNVIEIQPWFNSTCTLIVRNGNSIPVSRTFMKEIKQLLNF